MPMPMLKNGKKNKYTYADYCQWPSDERWEIIEGVPYAMSPAPATRHQEISWELSIQIGSQLKGRNCKGFAAPFDVVLSDKNKDEDAATVVQPDIAVICDESKIDDKGCKGAPDWIIEIVSPSSARHDLIRKLALYEKYGVREYWAVHPFYQMVTVHLLGDDGLYKAFKFHDNTAIIAVSVIPELKIDLAFLFPDAETEEKQSPAPGTEDR